MDGPTGRDGGCRKLTLSHGADSVCGGVASLCSMRFQQTGSWESAQDDHSKRDC